jgi:release factor glutamine methyltransferase
MMNDRAHASIRQAVKYASEQLTAITANHYWEAQLLLAHVTGLTVTEIHTQATDACDPCNWPRLEMMINRRLREEPLPYILGQWSFYDMTLTVNRHVLIPRPETEVLVDQVLALLPTQKPLTVVDLGTGSGAIALALAYHRPQCQLWALDSQPEALKVAYDNAKRYQLANIHWGQGAWLEPLDNQKVDVIVSNPPYVASEDSHFHSSSLQFEPRLALDGGTTGLAAIEHIIAAAPNYLTARGLLALEHGYDQQSQVLTLMRQYFDNVMAFDDLSGHHRVVIGQH